MNFQFGTTTTTSANKTTPSGGGLTFTAPVSTQAPGTLGASIGASSGFSGFGLASGDAKASNLSFTPLSTPTSGSGQKPAGFTLPTPSSSTTPSSVTTLSGFGLLSSSSPATNVTVTGSTGSLFSTPSGGSVKLGTPATITTTAATTTPASIGGSQPTGATSAVASLVTATTVTPSTATGTTPSSMNFVQLEELINKWTLELEEQEKLFINQATQVNAWDRLLNNNSEKIVELNNSVQNVKLQQHQLDCELDFILSQQRELEECLLPLEKELATTPGNVDPQREHMYHMAESLDTQLKQMSEDLKEIIEHLNESSKNRDNNDPFVQIVKILDAHMNSLQWIDEHVLQIQNKLDDVSKLHDLHRRENERSFRLTYDSANY